MEFIYVDFYTTFVVIGSVFFKVMPTWLSAPPELKVAVQCKTFWNQEISWKFPCLFVQWSSVNCHGCTSMSWPKLIHQNFNLSDWLEWWKPCRTQWILKWPWFVPRFVFRVNTTIPIPQTRTKEVISYAEIKRRTRLKHQ